MRLSATTLGLVVGDQLSLQHPLYVDAFEWVEMPNALGMILFAGGGVLAIKPYVTSAASFDRMSAY